MGNKTWHLGIVGCGNMGHHHFHVYGELPNLELVAGADVKKNRLDLFVEEFGVHPYTNYEEMLHKEDLDIIIVATPPFLHCKVTVKASKAGTKGIICEKPMALNMAEADFMVKTCKKNNTKLAIGHQRRFGDQYATAKKLVDGRAIGNLLFVESHWGKDYPKEMLREFATRVTYETHGGGPLPLLAIHILDLIRYYGGDAEWVLGNVDRESEEIRFETRASVYIKLKNGAYAYMDTGQDVRPGPILEISGTKGKIVVGSYNFLGIKTGENPRWIDPREKERTGFIDWPSEMDASLKAQMSDLMSAIEQNKDPCCSGKEGRAAHELMMALYESERTGMPVKLPLQTKQSPLKLMIDEGLIEKKDYFFR